MDEERLRPNHCLWPALFIPFNTSKLMAGWQEGHLTHIEQCSTNPQRFSSGGQGPEGEPVDPGTLGITSFKRK